MVVGEIKMPLDRTWENWGERYGKETRDYVQDSGYHILFNVCKIYAKYPKKIILNPYAKGYANGFCGLVGQPIPDPEPPPFEGGQCYEDYDVEVTTDRYFTNNGDYIQEITRNIGTHPGRIQSVRIEYKPIGRGFIGAFIVLESIKEDGSNHYYEQNVSGSNISEDIKNIEITRADGSPDICGNLPDEYPPDPELDPSDFNKNVIVNNYDEEGDIIKQNEYNLIIPENLGINFNTTVNLGGIKVDVDLGGISIGGGEGGSGDDDSGGGGETTKYKEPFDPGGLTKYFPPPSGGEDQEEEEEKTEEEVEDEEIIWILVDVTTFPTQGKTILQENPENNDYFAGYIHWTIATDAGSYKLPAIPIRKQKNAYKAPSDALGYSLYTVNGAAVKTTLYKQKIEGEEEENA